MGGIESLLDLLANTRQHRREHIVDASKPFAKADSTRDGGESQSTKSFVVVLEADESTTNLTQRSQALLRTLHNQLKPTQLFEAIQGFTVELSDEQANQLQGLPGVRSVEADRPLPLTPPVEVNWGPATKLDLNPQLIQEPPAPPNNNTQAVRLDTYWFNNKRAEPKTAETRRIAELAALPTYSNGTASSGEILP